MTKRPNNSADVTLVVKNNKGETKKWALGIYFKPGTEKNDDYLFSMRQIYSLIDNFDRGLREPNRNFCQEVMTFLREGETK